MGIILRYVCWSREVEPSAPTELEALEYGLLSKFWFLPATILCLSPAMHARIQRA